MHIAVCMDVAAERKQLERLLGRSADRRLSADGSMPIYVQSYGNKEAIINRCSMYDLFFINLLHDNMDSVQLIRHLRSLGVTSTICFCPHEEENENVFAEDENILILKQPIIADELEKILDTAVDEIISRVPYLEIRTLSDTVHIVEEQLMYAEKNGKNIKIHLNDNTVIETAEALDLFFERAYATFNGVIFLPCGIVCSIKAIAKTSFNSVTLYDGRKFIVRHNVIKKLSGIVSGDN